MVKFIYKGNQWCNMGFTDSFVSGAKRKITSFKQQQSEEAAQRQKVKQLEIQYRREKELELAKTRGYERAEKGSFARQLGQRVLAEAKKPSAPKSAIRNPAEPHYNLSGRKPKYIKKAENMKRTEAVAYKEQSRFAPAAFQKQSPRPFVVGGDQSASSGGLSMGMEMAFSGQKIERKPTAIDRAFFNVPEKKKKSLL